MRLRIFESSLYGILIILLLSLFYVQVFQGDYYASRSENNRIRRLPIKSARGDILDRNGQLMANSRPSINLAVIPRDFLKEQYASLAQFLNMSEQDIHDVLKNIPTYSSLPVTLQRNISRETAFAIEERQPAFSGVVMQVEPIRYYADGEVSSHVLGYLGRLNQKEFDQWKEAGRSTDTWIGRAGVEMQYDDLLRGLDGGKQVEVNARGQLVRVLSEREPRAGQHLTLTIDKDIQKVAWDALENKVGTVILVDVSNWEVLAVVSRPGFDPNLFVDPSKSKERVALLHDKAHPFINRAVSSSFPPGSVFKLVVATAGLETGKITPHTTFSCSGSLNPGVKHSFRCWNAQGHGHINLYQAIERSCNVYFYNVGRLVGAKNIAKYARLFGFGEDVGVELPGLAKGLVPDPDWKKTFFKKDNQWYRGETYNFAIGQGYMLSTPMQMARFVASIATKGRMGELTILKDPSPHKKTENIQLKKETIDTIQRGMMKVVESDRGTGQFARVEMFRIAAKTGTAEAPPNETHAWFGGFFPYEKPEVAMVVFLEHGGSGGKMAAPVAKQIAEGWYALKEKRVNSELLKSKTEDKEAG